MNILFPQRIVLSGSIRIVIFSSPFHVTPGAIGRLEVFANPGCMTQQNILKKGG